MESKTTTLIEALRALAITARTEDGVVAGFVCLLLLAIAGLTML